MVKHIPYDTYPAMILFLALLGVYTKEISLVITAIGILVLHFMIQQLNLYESWTFLAAVVGWIVLWNSYYYLFVKTSYVEHFETVNTRPCNVYFTKFTQQCDDGIFYKDVKYLESIRDIKLSGLEKDLRAREAELNKLEDSVNIVKAAIPTSNPRDVRLRIWRDPYRSISTYLSIRIDDLILQEQRKGSEQDASVIQSLNAQKRDLPKRVADIMKDTDAIYTVYQDQRTWKITTSVRDARIQTKRLRLQNEIALKKKQIAEEQNTQNFATNDAIVKEIKAGTTRCKSTYNGWFEPSSTGNMNLNDPLKNTTSKETILRGDPYAWAHCYQKNSSMNEWSRKQAYFETNKDKFSDISYANIPIPVGDGLGNGSNAFTGRFSFNRFSPSDQMECDDTLTTPDYPVIPNGLLEIKLDSTDNIMSMRRIMYQGTETRFIDPGLTKDIKEVDNSLLRSIFYTDGIDMDLTRPANAPVTWTRSLKAFLFPNKNIRYDVYYLYYDPKCGRFYGNTTHTGTIHPRYLGASKIGDLIGYSTTSASVVPTKIYFPDAQITDPEVLTYIFQRVPGFSQGRYGRTYSVTSSGNNNYIKYLQDHRNQMMNVDVANLNIRITDLDNRINANDVQIAEYTRQITEKKDQLLKLQTEGQCVKSPNNRWCIQAQRDITNLTNLMNRVNVTKNSNTRSKNGLITDRDRIVRIANEIQRFINTVDARTNTVSASQTLSSYIGRPITDFVKGYNASYLSNRRTMYLKITALVAARPAVFLHDPTTDAFSKRISLLQTPTLNDILDEDVDYEGDITFDDSELQALDLEYEEKTPETSVDQSLPPAPQTTDIINPIVVERFDIEEPYTVKLYDIRGNLLKTYSMYNLRENIRNDSTLYKKVYSLKINKGVTVTLHNGNNIITTYPNSTMATKPLDVLLNSTMTGDRCSQTVCTNYLEQIVIMQSN